MQPDTPSTGENSKGKFLSQEDIAEIRNALAIILGNTQLLEREPGLTEDQKEKLEIIAKQTHRIADILQEGQSDNPGKKEVLQDLKQISKLLE